MDHPQHDISVFIKAMELIIILYPVLVCKNEFSCFEAYSMLSDVFLILVVIPFYQNLKRMISHNISILKCNTYYNTSFDCVFSTENEKTDCCPLKISNCFSSYTIIFCRS